ncbi:MAG: NUDIX hydrolase N-terminal domain-containing protein [Clostridia bacterium]|nr:NUDIX hydrolase N-terminal domain-containing protein [Clostridia bacterium]
MEDKNQWLEWAKELQDLSQCALAYCKDKFDIERFERIRAISAEMAASVAQLPVETVKGMFCAGTGYQTARIETRAAVMRDGKLLMVQEAKGKWALPGGWQDYNQTVRENTVKEVLEEAGMRVRATRVIALHDYHRRNESKVRFPYNICKVFVLCEYISGEFQPNLETLGCGFFGSDEIPQPLATGKTTMAQVEMCFKAAADEDWKVEFD